MAGKEAKGVNCPFCGAPYRKLIPHDALQLKCDYCGATFRTPPHIGVEIPQCCNHPDRFATGICNDCEQNFCRECLHTYSLKTQNERAVLYLCPSCFTRRNIEKANVLVYSGFILLILSTLFVFVFWQGGVFLLIAGIFEIAYGISRRTRIKQELLTEEPETISGRAEEIGNAQEIDAETIYDELLTRYVDRWGLRTGTELLDNEIRAYTWNGETFAEAVRKVHKRQEHGR